MDSLFRLSITVNPYASPTQSHQTKPQSLWPRFIDWLGWMYPLCLAATAIGTTTFLRTSSLSVGPMQYDSYFAKAGDSQQFWYRMTLMLIILSPIAALAAPCLQLVWRDRPMRQRYQFVGITVGAWLVSFSLVLIAGVPLSDFLFD